MTIHADALSAGARDIRRAAQILASRVPGRLAPLAEVAYNFSWTWRQDGDPLFRSIDPYRWRACGQNPVRLLQEAPEESLERAALNPELVARAEALRDALEADKARPWRPAGQATAEHPVAFFCAEFGLHRALPIYSGGLGVLAGDILKEASDRSLPMVGVGLLYRQGYFHQRVDAGGWQHEYWYGTDPERRPCARITGADGLPLVLKVPIWGEEVSAHVWRVEVGQVPLFLLDADLPENNPKQRFITARLYEGNRQIRLAQYALLGVGGVRMLDALGIEPGLIHMNEGHPVAATLELVGQQVARGVPFGEACEQVRRRVVFTTHTPVPAGNETTSRHDFEQVMPHLQTQFGLDTDSVMALGRHDPNNPHEPLGVTAVAIRMSRSTNGVSRIHGEVSRRMWQPLFPGRSVDQVPIRHVTNGAHPLSWTAPSMRRLLDQYLPPRWHAPERITDPATWAAIDGIPDEALWAVRRTLSQRLVGWVRSKTVTDRLGRGDTMEYVTKAAAAFDPNVLTLGFARRVATYKRLHLLIKDPERFLRLLVGPRPVQLLYAGKAHPRDDEAKRLIVKMFDLKSDPRTGGRVAFIEDYDMGLATILTAGCDVWLNLPRPPLEASGTSGIKAAFSGTLNLSVLDGWWAEAFDGANGWGIDGTEDHNAEAKDHRDSAALFDLLEREVIPMYYERDEQGIPRGWVARIKASLRTIGPRFCAARMVDQYANEIYTTP